MVRTKQTARKVLSQLAPAPAPAPAPPPPPSPRFQFKGKARKISTSWSWQLGLGPRYAADLGQLVHFRSRDYVIVYEDSRLRQPGMAPAEVRKVYFEKVHKSIYYGRLIEKAKPEKNVYIHFTLDKVQSVHKVSPPPAALYPY
jgi:hypothetical protein